MIVIDTLKNLERLEALVEESRQFLGWFRLNDEEFFTLVNKIRASLPEDMRKAGKIAQNSERILETAQTDALSTIETAKSAAERTLDDAHGQAERILAAAREESERMQSEAQANAHRALAQARAEAQALVDQSEIARIAQAQSREIVAQSERTADEIRAGADDYAQDVLAQLETEIGNVIEQTEGRIGQTLSTIQRGRQKLARDADERRQRETYRPVGSGNGATAGPPVQTEFLQVHAAPADHDGAPSTAGANGSR